MTGFHILDIAPVHPLTGDHPLRYVFSVGDKHYYEFANPQSLYYDRFMAIQDKFSEVDQRVTRDYLQDMYAAGMELLNKGQLTEVAVLFHNMKQRLDYLPTVEHLYNICSVWFFDQHESPFVYDVVYGGQKIDSWIEHKEVLPFFLQTDMQKYFPSWDGLEMRIQDYSRAVASVDEQQWSYLLQRLSEMNAPSGTIASIKSRVETLRKLKTSLV